MSRNYPSADPIVSQIHAMLPNRSQKSTSSGQGSAGARPSSAGATRRSGSSFGYNKPTPATTSQNLYAQAPAGGVNAGLYGQGYNAQRPSSAGFNRPAAPASAAAPTPSSQYPNINQMNISGPPVSATLPANSQGGGSGRPKSAGAVRRSDPMAAATPSSNPAAAAATNVYTYIPQSYNIYANPFGQAQQQQQQQQQRPLSANAYTTTPHGGLANQWDSYKQYTQTPIQQLPTQQAHVQSQGAQPQLVGYGKIPIASAQQQQVQQPTPSMQRPQSAGSMSNKLRKAVDSSRGDEPTGDGNGHVAGSNKTGPQMMKNAAHLPIGELAGLDNDDDEGLVLGVEGGDDNIDGFAIKGAAAHINADDEEMDGKPISSSSHPEVSMTTPGASIELQNTASLAPMDARNTSLDSFSDEHLQIGLSTVPNQFCTKRDALELRKLLVLSQGTRGGVVPSSSAVMDMYMVGKVVGVGSYGKVRAAWHRLTSAKVAIKTYDKAKLKDPAHWKRVASEIKIMEQISHPRIARIYEAVETPKRMHLIMECLDGGNLCSYVKAKRRLTEDESKRIFFQILTAIEYIHSLGVAHRDIKLENVLFANEKEIKLIDFGFSTVCQPGKKLKVFCGTPSYMAPEIVRRAEYEGKPTDIWSLGILLYALLCGCFPFRAKAYPDLYRRIARGAFQVPEELSAPVKDLLRQMLTVDVDSRITANGCMRHPWLQSQLLNAPNMDKMRQETTILISEKPADDLDEQVLSELATYGMSRDEMIRLVLTKTHSSISTLYYLLLDATIKQRKAGKKIAPSTTVAQSTSRPHSANYNAQTAYVAAQAYGAQVIKPIPTPIARAAAPGPVPGQGYDTATQQDMERQEYRYRPKSASATRSMTPTPAVLQSANTGPVAAYMQAQAQAAGHIVYAAAPQTSQQRPLSAFAGRR